MKTSHFVLIMALGLLIISGCTTGTHLHASGNETQVKDMVTSQDYTFEARSASPSNGRTRQLTSGYDLKVSKDSIEAYLPYFGRVYSAPVDPTKGGIMFNSKDFDYTLSERKNGGWDISIKPKNVRDVQQMTLTISSTGYASLQVISNHRQPIIFNGIVEKSPQQDQQQ